MYSWNLNNKKALVTGGSKGIGNAIVRELAGLGAEVLFTARQDADLQSTLKELMDQGFKVHGLQSDVARTEDRQLLFDWVQTNWGKLDILVNNAGINLRKPTNAYSTEEYQQVLNTDLIAPFELSRLCYELLKESGHGTIVNIASVAGSFDAGTGSPYGMAKAGLIQLTRNLAAEWAADGIRVNAVSPWFTQTPLTRGLLTQPEKLNRIISRTPQQRIGQDWEIAAAAAFLAMDKAAFITGQNLSVDGGATISIL